MPLDRVLSFRSITSSIVSRKSSSRSIGSNRSKGTNRSYTTNRSNVTITSNGSFVKKNSGNFDGGNSRSRRKSSLQRKSSTASVRREQMIAEFYRDLEDMEEISSSDSSDDEEGGGTTKKPKKVGKIELEEVKGHQRVEEYLMNLGSPDPDNFDEDEGIISDTTNKSDQSHDDSFYNNDKSYDMDIAMSPSNKKSNKKNRKYIKRPSPPENIIKNLDSSPITHRQKIKEEKTSRALLDINRNSVSKSSNSSYTPRTLPAHPKGVALIDKNLRESFNKKNNKLEYHRVPTRQDLLIDTASESSCSTDSAHGSTRSISTVSSVSAIHSPHKQIHQRHFHSGASVPKNFIPGQTKPVLEQRKKNQSLPTNNSHVKPRKVSFCFRGIPFRVFNNTPRTYRALAHAGCIGLIIPAPESHKCKH